MTTQKKSLLYPVAFMFTITLVSTGVLIGANLLTADLVQANKTIFFERAVLDAAGIDETGKLKPLELHELFTELIRPPDSATAGAYTRVVDGNLVSYILPFKGKGYWNQIRGVIGTKPDGRTLTGIAFYEQNETPGLGAEIVKPAFTDQFEGVVLLDRTQLLRLAAVAAPAEGVLQAITGATQTCSRLEKILNDALSTWRARMGFLPGNPQGDVR